MLTPNQKHASITTDRSVAVIAGAGSGKTRVLIERYKNLIQSGTPPWKILAFTFTEKASQEMKDRILAENILTAEEEAFSSISTIHSFCNKVLHQHGLGIDLNPDFTLLSSEEGFLEKTFRIRTFLKQNLKNPSSPFFLATQKWGTRLVENFLSKLFENPLWLYETRSQNTLIQKILDETKIFFETGLNEKKQNGWVHLDDLEFLTYTLLKNDRTLCQNLQARYTHILVDEFQDTNPIQAKIINLLFNPDKNHLFFVGDPKQSIYRFRKADSALFVHFIEEIKSKGGIEVPLQETFRMAKPLCDFVNKIFEPLFEKSKNIWQPLVPSSGHDGLASIIELKNDENIFEEQIEFISKTILSKKPDEPFSNFAILVRKNAHRALLSKALSEKGIPCEHQARDFLDEPVFISLTNLLHYLSGKKNKTVLATLLRGPFLNFSESFIQTFLKTNPESFTSLFTPDLFWEKAEKEKWEKWVSFIEKWEEIKKLLPASLLFDTIITDLSDFSSVNENDVSIRKFVQIINDWASEEKEEALETLSYSLQNLFESEKGLGGALSVNTEEAVSILTIHKAKGLEFECVFIPLLSEKERPPIHDFYLDDTKNWHFRATYNPKLGLDAKEDEDPFFEELKEKEKEEIKKESLRLFYVALTRAKKHLVVFTKNPGKKVDISKSNSWNEWVWGLTQV